MFQKVLAGSLKGLCVLAYRLASEPAPRFSASPSREGRRNQNRIRCRSHTPRAAPGLIAPAQGSGLLLPRQHPPHKKRFKEFIEYSPIAALIRAIFGHLFGKILILPNFQKAKILIYQCFPPFASLFTASNGQIAISTPHRYAALESIKSAIADAIRDNFQLSRIYANRWLIHKSAVVRLLQCKNRHARKFGIFRGGLLIPVRAESNQFF